MEAIKKTTLVAEEETEKLDRTAFGSFLIEYSEITFVYTAVPTFLLALTGLLTGILLFVHKSEYDDCKKSNDMLFGFLIGQMIFYYSFGLIYANLLFQLVPYLHSLTVTFILFACYFISNAGWTLWGIQVLTVTGCDHSTYYGIASFTIAFTLAFDLSLLVATIVVFFRGRKNNVAPKENAKKSVKENPNISKVEEQKGSGVLSGEEQWKQEDLDGF